jgi:ABC-2 type transport system permease protein
VPFLTHLRLIWGLRLTVAANRFRSPAGALPAILGAIALAAISLGLGFGAAWALSHPVVAASPIWSRFLLRLFCFLTSAVFVTWPLLSAGVDEHSELSRFSTFPIRPFRLFAASSVSALFEPRALVFYPVAIGAAVGYSAQRPFPAWIGVLLIGGWIAFNVAWGRAGLTLVLNVLRHRRSAEILGLFFLGTLFLASLVPPIDVSWLRGLLQGGAAAVGAIDDRMVKAASHAIAQTPPGKLAVGIELAAAGYGLAAVICFVDLVFWAAVGFGISFWLLLRFYRGTAKPERPRRERRGFGGRHALDGAFWALLEREASDFFRNPKARLLIAVPFFLCILLRLVSARGLAEAFLGQATDAWLVVTLCAYAGLVVGANFAQNLFAYDGAGLALLYAAPVELRTVIAAKNLVHAGAAMLVALLLTLFYGLWVHRIGPGSAAMGVLALAAQMPVLLMVGNLLSIVAPRKFHASLRRRDRPPPVATMVGLATAAVSVAPAALVLRIGGAHAPGLGAFVAMALAAAIGWTAYARALPHACRLLEARRESVLRLVMRE